MMIDFALEAGLLLYCASCTVLSLSLGMPVAVLLLSPPLMAPVTVPNFAILSPLYVLRLSSEGRFE